jgi:hypothetical protein
MQGEYFQFYGLVPLPLLKTRTRRCLDSRERQCQTYRFCLETWSQIAVSSEVLAQVRLGCGCVTLKMKDFFIQVVTLKRCRIPS